MNQWQTVGEVYRQASSFLGNAFEAELLLRKMLGYDRTSFYMAFSQRFPQHKMKKWKEWLNRRRANQPIQYIIGEQEFYGRVFEVNESVLIPRPETEILVEKVLEQIDKHWGNQPVQVVDLGTGSGAIAVTLAAERSHIRVIAIDCSKEALQVATKNADRYGVGEQVVFLQGDFLAPLWNKEDSIDVVVSNPPYIPSKGIHDLESQVRDFEPILALDGGNDGLQAYRKILSQLQTWKLYSNRFLLAFEIGYTQREQVEELIRLNFDDATVKTYPDLAGLDRVVIAYYV